jgi:DNA (cytosine-5)-methyltransferase 1
MQLVLSLFPGIGLLDMAFEAEGFCVVRGPDLLWGGDIRSFHPPAGKFDGVIGGPPCQRFSRLANIVIAVHGEASLAPDLIPEFERCVDEAQPAWFLMENVPAAPTPMPRGYAVHDQVINNRWLGEEQNRTRRFSFGSKNEAFLRVDEFALYNPTFEPAVCSTAGGRRASVAIGGSGKPKGKQGRRPEHRLRNRTLAKLCELQGLPPDFLTDAPFTKSEKERVVGNGVPLPMGRAVAKAVKRALGIELPVSQAA